MSQWCLPGGGDAYEDIQHLLGSNVSVYPGSEGQGALAIHSPGDRPLLPFTSEMIESVHDAKGKRRETMTQHQVPSWGPIPELNERRTSSQSKPPINFSPAPNGIAHPPVYVNRSGSMYAPSSSGINTASATNGNTRDQPTLETYALKVSQHHRVSGSLSSSAEQSPNDSLLRSSQKYSPHKKRMDPLLGSLLSHPAEAMEIAQSFRHLNARRKALGLTAEDAATMCGWQVNQSKFVNQEPLNVPIAVTGRQKYRAGSIGEVEEVADSSGCFPSFVRRRIPTSRNGSIAGQELELIKADISNLGKLTHPHVVKIIGAYQEEEGRQHCYSILLYPVGENDLSTFLEEICKRDEQKRVTKEALRFGTWIKMWFGCLAAGLAYMHSQQVLHPDLKPQNVVHRGAHIFFTDFRSSKRLELVPEEPISRATMASRLFVAPEPLFISGRMIAPNVLRSNVFSLGLIFIEMLTVLIGSDIDSLHRHLKGHEGFGDGWQTRQYHRVVPLLDEWFDKEYTGHDMYRTCIKPMLNANIHERPGAQEVVRNIHDNQPWGRTLACPCRD